MGDYSMFLWQLSLLCVGLFQARFMPNSSLSPVKSPGITRNILIASGSSASWWSYKTNIGFIKLGKNNQESTWIFNDSVAEYSIEGGEKDKKKNQDELQLFSFPVRSQEVLREY